MNNNQRVVLVVGVIVLLIAVWTTPQYVIWGNKLRSPVTEQTDLSRFSPMWDYGAVIIRAASVLVVTAVLFLILKDKE